MSNEARKLPPSRTQNEAQYASLIARGYITCNLYEAAKFREVGLPVEQIANSTGRFVPAWLYVLRSRYGWSRQYTEAEAFPQEFLDRAFEMLHSREKQQLFLLEEALLGDAYANLIAKALTQYDW